MIIGIGTDLCDIRRIEKTLKRFGQRFIMRVFTENERTTASRRSNPAAAYAQRYAAKEACAKALGTGFSQGVFWSDIGVNNNPYGQPYLSLTGGALRRLDKLTPPAMKAQIDISLSDQFPMSQAMVVISAEIITK